MSDTRPMRSRQSVTKYKVALNVNADTHERLNRLRDRYRDIVGRPPSRTVMIRRALELLEERLSQVTGADDMYREALTLNAHVGEGIPGVATRGAFLPTQPVPSVSLGDALRIPVEVTPKADRSALLRELAGALNDRLRSDPKLAAEAVMLALERGDRDGAAEMLGVARGMDQVQ